LLLGAIVTLSFEQHSIGHVLVRRNPAAVGHGVVHCVDDAAITGRDSPFCVLSRFDAVDNIVAVLFGISGERACFFPMRDQLP